MIVQYLCMVLVLSRVSGNVVSNRSLAELNLPWNFANRLQDVLKDEVRTLVSPQCKAHLWQYARSLFSLKLEDFWAKEMLDSGAKIPSGILKMPTGDLGSFDECLKIDVKRPSYAIQGQYCVGTIPLPAGFSENKRIAALRNNPEARLMSPDGQTGIAWGTCVPSGCSATEIQRVFSRMAFGMVFHDDQCQTKDSKPELAAGTIAAITFFGVILCVMLASTTYDTVIHYLQKKVHHPILIAFSVLTNTKKLLATSSAPNQISCIHGIRVISTMWIILGHIYSIQLAIPLKNFIDTLSWTQEKSSNFILGATVSVDTFFFIAGMVISYSYMCAATKGVKFNIIMYYIHRYIRLTPILAVVILIHATLMEYMGSGPLYSHMIERDLAGGCRRSWWKALLYIQNYGNLDVCISVSWYLSVDMQLFVFSPLLLLPMKRWPMFTMAATAFLTVCSIVICFLTGWFFELQYHAMGNTMDPVAGENYYRYYYGAPQARASVWLLGIILGYIIFLIMQKRTKVRVNKWLIALVWAVSLAVLCVCVFAGHIPMSDEYNRVENSFALALLRPAWGLAVGLVILACVSGYGGPVNWFLSLPVFQVVSKLTYTMYLIHAAVLYHISGQMIDAARFSDSAVLYQFWGYFALTLAVSFVLTLAFESPIITIEKVLFGGTAAKQKPPQHTNETYGTKRTETA